MCVVRAIAMLTYGTPVSVHAVGETDRPNQLHSDSKCIFKSFIPFTARKVHAVSRARGVARLHTEQDDSNCDLCTTEMLLRTCLDNDILRNVANTSWYDEPSL